MAVKELTGLLGSPTKRFASNGCGPNYTEVEWSHLYAEFRRDRLTGFRYVRGGWEGHAVTPGTGRVLPRMMSDSTGFPDNVGLGPFGPSDEQARRLVLGLD